MLICTCGRHNSPGDSVCPGDCDGAVIQAAECAAGGHLTPRRIAAGHGGVSSLGNQDECFRCGETEVVDG